MTKRILMILETTYPNHSRVEKEARALKEAGYNNYLLCCKKNVKDASVEELGDLAVYRFNRKRSYLNKAFFLITAINIQWFFEIIKAIKLLQPDIIHVNDLPLARTAFLAAKIMSVRKKVLDLHENYPAAIKAWGVTGIPMFFLSTNRWKKIEKKQCKVANKVLVVVEEARDRLVREYGINSDKIFVVSNTEDVDFFSKLPIYEDEVKKYKDGVINLLYIGCLGPHRGVDTAIKGLAEYKKNSQNKPVRIIVAGSALGNDTYLDYLKDLVCKLGLDNSVVFTGWLDFKFYSSYLNIADIGLVPHNSNDHTEATVPHKLFQLMLFGKPVLVSSCAPLKRIIAETAGGWVFNADNPESFAAELAKIVITDFAAVGEKGKQAILGGYNWCDRDAKVLVHVYDDLTVLNK